MQVILPLQQRSSATTLSSKKPGGRSQLRLAGCCRCGRGFSFGYGHDTDITSNYSVLQSTLLQDLWPFLVTHRAVLNNLTTPCEKKVSHGTVTTLPSQSSPVRLAPTRSVCCYPGTMKPRRAVLQLQRKLLLRPDASNLELCFRGIGAWSCKVMLYPHACIYILVCICIYICMYMYISVSVNV